MELGKSRREWLTTPVKITLHGAAGEVTPGGTGPLAGTSTTRAPRLSIGRNPKRAARSRRTDAGPYTIISAAGRSVRARALSTTSGPMPAGSPTVSASRVTIAVG